MTVMMGYDSRRKLEERTRLQRQRRQHTTRTTRTTHKIFLFLRVLSSSPTIHHHPSSNLFFLTFASSLQLGKPAADDCT